MPPSGHNPIQNRLLDVEAVFRLIENSLGVRLEGRFIDLFATVSRQAMHDERAGPGQFYDRIVDLVTLKRLDAFGGLSLFAH